MATVIVTSRKIVSAKGVFLEGDPISGKPADLQPLVDSGSARWEGAEIKWTLTITPADYLERYPEGPNAELARQVIDAEEGD